VRFLAGFSRLFFRVPAQKLEQSEKEIKEKCPTVEIRRIQADFSRTDAKLYADIKSGLAGLDIGVLVGPFPCD
jgi:short-subunit dehydrogenase